MNRFEAIKTALPGEHDTVGCQCSETALSQWEMIPSNSLFSFISILILTLFYTHTHSLRRRKLATVQISSREK